MTNYIISLDGVPDLEFRMIANNEKQAWIKAKRTYPHIKVVGVV